MPIGNMAVENVIEPSAPIENMAVENVIEPPVSVEAATEPLAGEGAVAHQIAEAPVMDGEASPGHGGDGVPEDVVVEAPRGRGRGRGRRGGQQGLSEENRQICRELLVCFSCFCDNPICILGLLQKICILFIAFCIQHIYIYIYCISICIYLYMHAHIPRTIS